MFLFPLNPPQKKKKHSQTYKSFTFKIKKAQLQRFPPSPERSTEKSIVVKGHKSSPVYCFPLRSPSTGLKVSAESQAEQVWLGDDLHLHRISAAPPGGVGRLTLLLHRHTITACKAIHAHSLGNCQLWGCSDSCHSAVLLKQSHDSQMSWMRKWHVRMTSSETPARSLASTATNSEHEQILLNGLVWI